MEKTKMIAHTKSYLEKLGNGVDPITGQRFSESVLKRERVAKCLSYCAGVFGRALAEGGVSEDRLRVYKRAEFKNEEAAIAVARDFLEKLSRGEDPLSGSVSQSDVVRHERISKCLSYAAQQLESAMVVKRPFDITEEALERFRFSDEPIKITEIKRRADALVDGDCMSGIPAPWLTQYLVSIRLLEEQKDSYGKNRRLPTLMGRQLGITEDIREYRGRESSTVLYSRKMQELIVRNIPQIIKKYAGAGNGADDNDRSSE